MLPRTHLEEDFAVRRQSPIFAKFMSFLFHIRVTRPLHFLPTKNLPFSAGERKICFSDCICAELKPSFYKQQEEPPHLSTKTIKANQLRFQGTSTKFIS